MKKVIDIIDFIVICFLGIIILSTLVLYLLNYRVRVVVSGSMEPKIQTGSLMWYKEIKEEDVYEKISVDTIITYRRNDGVDVTHQVISIDRETDTIITKSIVSGSTSDSPIKASQVLGIYAFSIPLLGFIIDFFKKPFVLIGIIIIVLFILCNLLFKFIKDYRKQE